MTTVGFTRWRRGATLLAAGLLAGAVTVSLAGPAIADPSAPPPSTAPGKPGGSTVTPVAGSITWSVQPSTADGPDRRSSFTYTNIKPGTIVHDYVGITNYSKMPVTFKVYSSDAFNTASGSLDLLPATEKPKDVGAWVGELKDTVTIAPGARVNEPFSLTVPDNAAPGDHTGGLIASVSTSSADGKGGNVNVDRRLAVPLFLRVSGALHQAVAIESLTTDYHGILNPFGGGGTDVSYTLHNTGNSRLNVSQDVSVTGLFGINLGSSHPKALTDLLPGATYRVTQHLTGVLPLGPLTAHVNVAPTGPAGVTQADPPPAAVSNDAGLWATPWPQLLILLLVVALAFGVRWWIRRGRQRTQRTVAVAVAKAKRDTRSELAGASVGGSTPSAGVTPDAATGSAPTTETEASG